MSNGSTSVPTTNLKQRVLTGSGHPSFGFGGSNAHAILESYSRSAPRRRFTPSSVSGPVRPVVSPFIFTAASEHSLGGSLEAFRQFLATNGASLDLRDLAFTLHSRRTWFPVGVAFSATSADELAAKIGQRLEIARSSTDEPLGTRSRLDAKARPRILAVFTGQGAQWPRMAAELLDAAPRARAVFENLEARLARLPPQDRPPWGLTEELLKSASSSRVSDAALSQPLCTAVQILLVDLLHAAGIELRAAVGHSSGEIAAAYAAGMITAEDAICIAYYRGLHTKLARGPHGQTGAMLAVGTSPQDAADILSEPEFHGRACVAAVNSSASVTLSGDADAVEELRVAFNDEKKFARLLRVEKAYHSHHMLPCSTPYLESLRQLAIQVSPSSDPGCAWFSSVCDDEVNDLAESLKSHYWDRNMQSPVLFKQAVERACAVAGPFDMAIEIGPHPALKGPALQTLQDATGLTTPYTGLLQRGESDIKALAEGLGYISTNLGKGVVDFQGYETFMSLPSDAEPQLVKGLPSYFWNHENEYWHESRYARAIRSRNDSVHELLGHLAPNATEHNMQWRHLLCPKEETWLRGHQLQNQIVFPAAGYVVAALEASMAVLNRCGESALSIEVLDIEIGRALPFYSEESSVEVITSLSNIRRLGDSEITGHFDFSAATGKTGDVIESLARGSIRICLGTPSPATLPSRGPRPPSLIKLNAEDFYRSLSKLDYQYTDHFVALHDLERRLGAATGFVTGVEGSRLLVHPAVLDASFQSIILAASAPDDGKLWSMHVPTRIRRVRVNPYLCKSASAAGAGPFPFDASQPERVVLGGDAAELSGDVDLFPADGSNHAMVQVEGLECVPLAPATQRNDRVLFSSTVWGPATPDATLVAHDGRPTQHQQDLAHVLERVARFYLAKLEREVPTEDPSRQQGPYVSLFKFASHVLTTGGDGRHNPEWVQDTEETINRVSGAFSNAIDMRLLHAIGQRLTDIVMNRAPAIEVGMKDNLLEQFYREGLGMGEYLRYLGRVVKQILHLSPRIECLEIGAGTGAATEAVLRELVHSFPFSSYTFTDVSSGFFGAAETAFSARASPERLLFKVLDIGVDPCEQGFEEHSYDLIVASMVLHATPSLTQTLQNVRRLLKPGGYLVALEAHPDGPARVGTMFGAFPGWWVGAGEGRVLSPCASVVEWDRLLRETGFSGCDTTGPDSDPFVQPIMLFVSQAMDDRVAFLRDPLVHVFRPDPQGSGVGGRGNSPPLVEDLVLLGGQSIKTARITAELETLLRPWCSAVRRVRSLTDLHRMGGTISSGTIVLSVSDVDSPVFENITGAAWDALRLVLREAGSVLWVTKDRRAGNPFANMMVGLLRSVANERPDLEAQLLDIEDTGRLEARTIGEALLHFKASASWCREGSSPGHQSSICFKVEPELVIERGGSVVVPRLVADQAKNDRYNSTRRPIFSTTSIHAHVVSAVPARDGSGYFLRQEPAFQSTVAQETGIISDTSNRVSHSLLAPLRVAGHGHLFLSLSGIHSGNSSRSMILAAANASAVSPDAYLNLPVEIPSGFEPDFLYRVGLHYLISETFQDLAAGDRVLVHQADPELVAALRRRARRMDIEVTFVSSASHANTQSGHKSPVPDDCVELHTHSPERVFRVLKLASVSAFLDLAVTRESQVVAERIRSGLSSTCRCETLQTILGNQPRVPAAAQVGRVRERLEEAIAEARQDLGIGEATQGGGVADLRHRIKAVKLSQISGDASRHRDGGALAPISVIDWTAEDVVTTRVCPIDSMRQPLFLSNKTYWLVGLSGSLGLSLCRWMTGHGARHIVISSRKPNIDESWLGEMAVLGANIKVYACDVTKRDSLRATYADICANLPPVAGVAQGAMVLDDVGIGEMGLDTLQKVMRPKVEGSIHLSDLFQNPERNLDFFVLFSSVSSVIGTPGQAHYAAANTFMASLAQQRRQRGLTASIINIGPVYGVGYIAEQQVDTSTAMSWLAGMPISEQDFHALFAEGVVTGHPSSPHSSVEVTTGVKQVRLDEENLPPWSANPFMSHYVLNGQAAEHGEGSAARPKASLKTRLADALTQGEAQVYDLVREALIEKLGTLFQLDAKGIHTAALDTTRLDDLGLDSLIATEIRAWLMKNFQVTYPVLKLLSGVCVAELVKDVVDGIMAAADTPTTNARPPTPPESTSSDSPSSRMHQSLPADSSGETWTEATPSSSSAASDGDAMDDALQTRKADAFCPPVLASIGLSVTQKMFWIASTIFESRTSLNLAGVTRLTSTRPLRVQDLEKAVQAVGQQHESLRTSFFVSEGQPKQGILSSSLLRLEYRQISDVAEVKRAAREVQKHVYDIEHGETVRLILLSMSSNNHFLVVGATHLAMDGSSVQVLLRSVFQHYSRGQLVSAPIQYRDYLERQSRELATGTFEKELRFWKSQFPGSDFPPSLPILRVSRAVSRSSLARLDDVVVETRIAPETRTRIRAVCRQHRITPFHFYLAVFRVLLSRYADIDDLAIGILDANRNSRGSGSVTDGIGVFVNVLPLRFPNNSLSSKFDQVVQETRAVVLRALENSAVPFQAVLGVLDPPRSTTCTPVFQSCVNYRPGMDKLTIGDCELELLSVEASKTGYDLNLDVVDSADPDGMCIVKLIARSDLYQKVDADTLIKSYKILVEAFAEEPQAVLTEPNLYDSADVQTALMFSQGWFLAAFDLVQCSNILFLFRSSTCSTMARDGGTPDRPNRRSTP